MRVLTDGERDIIQETERDAAANARDEWDAYRDSAGRWRDQLVATAPGTVECQHGVDASEPCASCAWIESGDDGPETDDPSHYAVPTADEPGF